MTYERGLMLLLCLFACKDPKRNISFIPEKYIPMQLDSNGSDWKQKIKFWHLRDIDTFLQADSLTYLYIPQSAFVNTKGDIVDEYYIFLTKFNTSSEFIMSNLQTLSSKELLESNGMFCIEAKDVEGNSLEIASNKVIGIESFYSQQNRKMDLYKGDWNNGNVNWSNPVKADNYLVCIPFLQDDINLKYAFDGLDYLKPLFDTTGNSQLLLNSYFATREFLTKRLHRSLFEGANYLKIYYNNAGKNLYEADSLCMVYEKEHRYQWKDKFAYTMKESQKTGLPLLDVSERRIFFEERLTKPKVVNTFGINLDGKDARKQLNDKGLSEVQIDEAFLLHQRRKSIAESMDAEKDFSDFFTINKMGWYNFDKVVDLKDALIADVSVSIEGAYSKDIKVYYVLSDRKSVIYSKLLKDNIYTIDYADGPNAKLPKGSKLIAIAVSFTENNVLVGSSVLDLTKKNNIKLESMAFKDIKVWIENTLRQAK